MEIETLIEGFRLYNSCKALSPKTITWYDAFLRHFADFLRDHEHPTQISELSISHLRAWLHRAQERGLSPYTVQGQARTLRAFFRFAQEEGYLETNIASRLEVPRAPKKIIQTFSEEQLRQLLGSAKSTRDKAILGLFIDTGIRVTELASLTIQDVDLDRGRIKVNGKGAKERVVVFGNKCRRLLWRYIKAERPNVSSDRLFINSHGQPLKARGILEMMRRCGKRAAITGVRCSPHTLRHTFAKRFLLNGGDVFTLQQILGHSSLEMVRKYLALCSQELGRLYRPPARLTNWGRASTDPSSARCSASFCEPVESKIARSTGIDSCCNIPILIRKSIPESTQPSSDRGRKVGLFRG